MNTHFSSRHPLFLNTLTNAHFSSRHPLFVCAQNTFPSHCHPSFLNELTNVLSFPSSSFCMRSKYSSPSLSSLVFDGNQKRQGICSSCHPSKCVCISSRDLRYFYNLKIAGRFCIQQNRAMT